MRGCLVICWQSQDYNFVLFIGIPVSDSWEPDFSDNGLPEFLANEPADSPGVDKAPGIGLGPGALWSIFTVKFRCSCTFVENKQVYKTLNPNHNPEYV